MIRKIRSNVDNSLRIFFGIKMFSFNKFYPVLISKYCKQMLWSHIMNSYLNFHDFCLFCNYWTFTCLNHDPKRQSSPPPFALIRRWCVNIFGITYRSINNIIQQEYLLNLIYAHWIYTKHYILQKTLTLITPPPL